MKTMLLGIILLAIGVSTAGSDNLIIPCVSVLLGAYLMLIGQALIEEDNHDRRRKNKSH